MCEACGRQVGRSGLSLTEGKSSSCISSIAMVGLGCSESRVQVPGHQQRAIISAPRGS